MYAKKTGEKIEITFQYEQSLVALVKSFSGRKYHAGSKSWSIPLAGSSQAVESLLRRGFRVSPELLSAIEADKAAASEAEAMQVMDDTEFTSPLPLFPFQKVGAAFLYKIGSGLLGDQPGLGKTLQSLAVCVKSEARKVLIFCPAAVKYQWQEEIRKFLGDVSVTVSVVDGNKKERDVRWKWPKVEGALPLYVIANYELLLRDLPEMQAVDWDVIIADEATRISNPQAKQSKAIKKLKSKRRLALTGTPISNRANEVWNILDFCSPGAMGDYWGFMQRYCLKNYFGAVSGYQNLDELNARIKRYMIRRLKENILPELPEKIETDIPFDLSKEEKLFYKKIKSELLFEIDKYDINKLENPMTIQYTLTKMIRLRQIADSMELLGENSKSSKIETLKELLKTILYE